MFLVTEWHSVRATLCFIFSDDADCTSNNWLTEGHVYDFCAYSWDNCYQEAYLYTTVGVAFNVWGCEYEL